MKFQKLVFKKKAIIITLIFLLLFSFMIYGESSNKKIVYDIDNNSITINSEVNKIVSLDAFTTQILLTLKEVDKLVAINYGRLVSKKLLFKYYPDVEEKSTIFTGRNINLEELIKLDPDIIISKKGYYYLKQIENYNFPIFLIDVETPDNFFKSIELIGKAISKENRANFVVNYLKSILKDIDKQSKNITHKYRVYFAGGTILSSYGNQAFQKYLADYAKLDFVSKNIDKFKIKIDPEQLIKWDPEVILLPSYCKTSIEDIKNDPVFKDIDAVKNNRIYKIPSFFLSWDLPEPEAFLSVYWIFLKVYHSTDETKVKMRFKIKEFYNTLYGVKITENEINSLINKYF